MEDPHFKAMKWWENDTLSSGIWGYHMFRQTQLKLAKILEKRPKMWLKILGIEMNQSAGQSGSVEYWEVETLKFLWKWEAEANN